MIRIVVAGATGWVGKALLPAIGAQQDMALAGAVARSAAGQDAGTAIGQAPLGLASPRRSTRRSLRRPTSSSITPSRSR